MKSLLLILSLSLSGCGVTTSQLVDLRHKTKEANILKGELDDNMQVSIFGMRNNKSQKVRDGFYEVAISIAGEPSFDEKMFAENATEENTKSLLKETNEFIKKYNKTNKDIDKLQMQIVKSHDEDNSMLGFLFKLLGIGLILAVVGYLVIKNFIKVPFV